MMTRAITDGKSPDDIYGEGKIIVKERFLTVAAYYAVTNVIKGIFDEIGKIITKAGSAIGGDTGSTIGSTISSAINVVVGYLCNCCLGWVFFGLFYLITIAFPEAFAALANEFAKLASEDESMEFLTNPNNLQLIVARIGGVIMWFVLHSTFVRPFILVGVLRNYIESGTKEKPTEKEFDELDSKSKKFAKLHQEVKIETK